MKYIFITGSSKGLGKAIVDELLKDSEVAIFGLSRKNSLSHPNFSFIKMDLSSQKQVTSFRFPNIKDAESIILINNAGIIGDIKPVGKKKSITIIETFQVNTITPSILINQFIQQFQNLKIQKTILNISSGAGRHTISSWAEYCASKAALDMNSMVIHEEQKTESFPVKIFSAAPGIIDTEMQTKIRSAKKDDFEKLDYFLELKEKNLLSSPSEIALKLLKIINNPSDFKNVLLDVRDF